MKIIILFKIKINFLSKFVNKIFRIKTTRSQFNITQNIAIAKYLDDFFFIDCWYYIAVKSL